MSMSRENLLLHELQRILHDLIMASADGTGVGCSVPDWPEDPEERWLLMWSQLSVIAPDIYEKAKSALLAFLFNDPAIAAGRSSESFI